MQPPIPNWNLRRPDIRIDRHPDRTVQGVLGQGIIASFSGGSNSRFGVGRDARRAEAGRGYPACLTAVYADSLDQDDLFAALRERRCYVTTGARILLQMTINGHEMGRLVEISDSDTQSDEPTAFVPVKRVRHGIPRTTGKQQKREASSKPSVHKIRTVRKEQTVSKKHTRSCPGSITRCHSANTGQHTTLCTKYRTRSRKSK